MTIFRLLVQSISEWLWPRHAEVLIELHDHHHRRGSQARGRVIVVAGPSPCLIKSIAVTLVEWRFSMDDSELPHRLKLCDDVRIEAADRQAFPFQLPIPDSAPLSRLAAGTRIEAHAEFWDGRKVRSAARPYILEHGESTAVQVAFAQIGFHMTGHREIWTHHREEIGSYVPSPDWERRSIHTVMLGYVVGRYTVTGSLKVTPLGRFPLRGSKIADFVIPRSSLLSGEGMPNPEPAIPHLRAALEEALRKPDDPARRLLRPSSQESSPEQELLRPAGTLMSEDDKLLRPADDHLRP